MTRGGALPHQLPFGGGGVQSFRQVEYYLAVLRRMGSKILRYYPLFDSAGPTALDAGPLAINGSYNGTYTLGVPGIGDGRTAAQFQTGVTTGVNVYSASLAATSFLDEGFISFWVKMSGARWQDAATYYFAGLTADGATGITARKTSSNNCSFYRRVGATLPIAQLGDCPTTDRFMHVIFQWSLSANSICLFINGTQKRPVTTAQPSGMSPLGATTAMIGSLSTTNTAQSLPGSMAHFVIGQGSITADEALILSDNPGARVVIDGDSRSNLTQWPATALESAHPSGDRCFGGMGLASWAVGGKTLAQMITTAPAEIDPLISLGSNTLVLWGGINDNGTSTADQIYNRMRDYCIARKSTGWQRVLLCKEIAASSTGWSAKYPAINAMIDADHSFCDGVIPLGDDPRLQNYSDLSYYNPDGVHLTAAGNAAVAEIATPYL